MENRRVDAIEFNKMSKKLEEKSKKDTTKIHHVSFRPDSVQIKEQNTMKDDNKEHLTKEEFGFYKEIVDLKIDNAIKPLESKIDNLPTVFENLLLKEREYQNVKRKETSRYLLGTIGIGVISILITIVSFFV